MEAARPSECGRGDRGGAHHCQRQQRRAFLPRVAARRAQRDPCTVHAPTREVAPFVLDLGDLGGGEAAGRRWNASWVDTSTGDSFPVVTVGGGRGALLSTRAFVGDVVLVGALN